LLGIDVTSRIFIATQSNVHDVSIRPMAQSTSVRILVGSANNISM
jgi:spore coat polysaccharide biosynthesis protein SpsF (cytidylyltransferase family)